MRSPAAAHPTRKRGFLRERGRDEARAASLLDRACDADADACEALAALYEAPKQLAPDPGRAEDARRRRCQRAPERCAPMHVRVNQR